MMMICGGGSSSCGGSKDEWKLCWKKSQWTTLTHSAPNTAITIFVPMFSLCQTRLPLNWCSVPSKSL
jgi:hypothetical protein